MWPSVMFTGEATLEASSPTCCTFLLNAVHEIPNHELTIPLVFRVFVCLTCLTPLVVVGEV